MSHFSNIKVPLVPPFLSIPKNRWKNKLSAWAGLCLPAGSGCQRNKKIWDCRRYDQSCSGRVGFHIAADTSQKHSETAKPNKMNIFRKPVGVSLCSWRAPGSCCDLRGCGRCHGLPRALQPPSVPVGIGCTVLIVLNSCSPHTRLNSRVSQWPFPHKWLFVCFSHLSAEWWQGLMCPA